LPKKDINDIWFIYAGTLGPSYDLINLLECAKFFNGSKYKLLIAGSGPLSASVFEFSKSNSNIIYLGKLKPIDLYPIYKLCDVGLATYKNGSNVDMPDKFYDYTAAGLAIINSLKGEVADYIEKYKLGINYDSVKPKNLLEAISSITLENLSIFKSNSFNIGEKFDSNVQITKLYNLVNNIIYDNKQ
jgi:glycosyltransferase involved in cell wall biosynthesis